MQLEAGLFYGHVPALLSPSALPLSPQPFRRHPAQCLLTQREFFMYPLYLFRAKPLAFAASCTVLALLALFTSGAARADAAADVAEVSRLIGARQFAQALARADAGLAANPRDPQMRFLRGMAQGNLGDNAAAIATFTQITEDYPELPEPYNNLAVLHAGQGRFDKARAALEMAIRTNPGYAVAHENLGDVYARLASQSYTQARKLDGTNASVAPKLALLGQLFAPAATKAAPAVKKP